MEYAFQKSTSKKLAPLKLKHVATLTEVTWHREFSELFRLIGQRTREPNWVVVFKCLILVHILIREGNTERVFEYLTSNPSVVDAKGFRDKTLSPLSVAQSKNIQAYSHYLEEKIVGYKALKADLVRAKAERIARIRSLPVEDGLLEEVQALQRQIDALLGCSFYLEEIDNVVTLQAFRLLIGDMMSLFHLLNEGVIRILGSYFEMAKPDATKALQIYKNFAQQTTKTVEFFDIARRLRNALGIDVPVFKHAPISLAGALEDYLKAPDFEAQRQAYKNKKSAKSKASASELTFEDKEKAASTPSSKTSKAPAASSPTFVEPPRSASPVKKEKQPEQLIDFFSSIDDSIAGFTSPTAQADFNFDMPSSIWAQPVDTSFAGMTLGDAGMGMSSLSSPSPQVTMPAGSNPFGMTSPNGVAASNQLTLHPFASNASTQMAMGGFGGQSAFGANSMALQTGGMGMNMGMQQQTVTSPMSQQPFGGMNFGAQSSMNPSLDPFHKTDPSFTVENVFGNAGGAGVGAGGFGSQQLASPFPSVTGNSGNAFGGNMASGGIQPFGAAGSAMGMGMAPGMAKSATSTGVTDHLASLNPFAKPSVPLAMMGSNAGAGPFGGAPGGVPMGGSGSFSTGGMNMNSSAQMFGTGQSQPFINQSMGQQNAGFGMAVNQPFMNQAVQQNNMFGGMQNQSMNQPSAQQNNVFGLQNQQTAPNNQQNNSFNPFLPVAQRQQANPF
ncbi:hypothetical protein HDU76_011445 [Blyttiomyces sp. JEL0837]|nr:hypothetical protein HDU76_011445 [Blyttiomyces sp. JEL0837]